MASFTVSLTGDSSELTANFFPEIVLDERYEYICGLLDFTAYHSIPNVTNFNNRLYYINTTDANSNLKFIEVPVGCYEADEILRYIKHEFEQLDISFGYLVNKNTFKTTIKCSASIQFGYENSILGIFGFVGEIGDSIPKDARCESTEIIKISRLHTIRIDCNIVSGAYVNGELSHSIYEFPSNKVDVGYKIIEQPRNIIYLPIIPKRINFIQISIVDQDGQPIDFHGEKLTCRIHIKRSDI